MPTISRIDRYQVLRLLGEGLTGEVYLVETPEGQFALKLLKPFQDRKLEASIVGAFKFEFGFLKDLKHPNVVRIQDFGFAEELRRFYFTEEYLEGETLNDYCAQADPDCLEGLFLQAIEGLQAIHRAHILHGDLKGSNLIVINMASGPLLKIIDLGLSDPRFPLTAGTPSTMSPEKILKDPVDERSDLYSLGVVFYQIWTGENPFVRDSVQKTYEAHLSVKPPKPTLKNPGMPLYLNEILCTLLAKNPNHRYRSCAELLEAIDFARPQKSQAPSKSRPWSLDRWMGRSQLLEELSQQIREALGQKSPAAPGIFLLSGEPGVGKSRIVQELKYLFQMEKVKVFESKPGEESLLQPASESSGLWIIDEWSRFSPAEQQSLLQRISRKQTQVLLLTLFPEEVSSLEKILKEKSRSWVALAVPPFSKADLQRFLEEITGQPHVPDPLLEGLWEKTQGNPQLVIALLEHWATTRRLVDDRGEWNLAIFKEGLFDLQPVPLQLSEIDQALQRLPATEHPGRAELWIKRADELLKTNRFAEAQDALGQAEAEIHHIEDLSLKLHFRARTYEKQGWSQIRQGHLAEARTRLERGLALLEASSTPDEVLSIRLNNFVAWLLCQEGKLEESIALFEAQERRWEKLKVEEQSRALNSDLGYAYLLKGDIVRAISILENSLAFYEKIQDRASLMKGYYNLAEAVMQAKDYPKAVHYYLRSAELARLDRNFELLLRAYNGLGKTHHLQGSFSEGMAYYSRALELARYLEDYSSAAAIAQNIGSIQMERGDLDAAHTHFELALKMLKKLPVMNAHAKYLQCRALLEIGDLFRRRKKFEEALSFVHDADQLARQESSLAPFRFWVLQTRAQIEKDQGHLEELQDLMAELLPLADDEEKKAFCRQLAPFLTASQSPPPKAGDRIMKDNQTKLERIRPTLEKTDELGALIRVARWMASEKDPERLLALIVRQAVELSGAEAGLILVEDDQGNLAPRAEINLNLDDSLIQMSEGIAKEVLNTGKILLSEDALNDPRFDAYQSVIEQHLQSILAIPIQSQNGTLGVLALVHRHRSQAFPPDSQTWLMAFADQAGIALENARLIAKLETSKSQLASDLDRVEEELNQTRKNLSEQSLIKRFLESKLISQNKTMLELFRIIDRVRDTTLSVLLQGESGTGKELIARSLHQHSRRAKAPFVAVNCAALPPHLIESELFGYKAGAFTGAVRDKKGLIAEAQDGTLFLDEIAELELNLQAKLLRVLQEKEITRVGDTKPTPVNFRLISASHKSLKEQIALGKFREDLFYRVCEIELRIPPLRERREDIPLLAEEMVRQYLKEQGEKSKVQLGRDLLKTLLDHAWPGNVRELENVIRVATALRRGNSLHLQDLPASLQAQLSERAKPLPGAPPPAARKQEGRSAEGVRAADGHSLFDPQINWDQTEQIILAKALGLFDFDVAKAAKSLGCAVSKLYQRIREQDLENRREEFVAHRFVYSANTKLEEIKRKIFSQALKHCGGSPYQTAELLGVSPGMVYKWTR